MPIHLVGETIDRRRADLKAPQGELEPLVRGVYAVADGNVDAAVMAHAVRIAHYLHPQAYLSSASAAFLAPGPDGRLFLRGRRNQRTRIRGLEIVQNQGPGAPSLDPVVVGDDMGELRLSASSLRQPLLEAFRLGSEHASAVGDDLRGSGRTAPSKPTATPARPPTRSGRWRVSSAVNGKARGPSGACPAAASAPPQAQPHSRARAD